MRLAVTNACIHGMRLNGVKKCPNDYVAGYVAGYVHYVWCEPAPEGTLVAERHRVKSSEHSQPTLRKGVNPVGLTSTQDLHVYVKQEELVCTTLGDIQSEQW
jgi:hypothetical protein